MKRGVRLERLLSLVALSVTSIQVSGDLAVLTIVNQAHDAMGPDFSPTLTAIRVVRLR